MANIEMIQEKRVDNRQNGPGHGNFVCDNTNY